MVRTENEIRSMPYIFQRGPSFYTDDLELIATEVINSCLRTFRVRI